MVHVSQDSFVSSMDSNNRGLAVQGESLLDVASKTTRVVAAEYAQYTEATWSSKGMLEVIRRKMSAAALDSPDRPSTSTSSPLGGPFRPQCILENF